MLKNELIICHKSTQKQMINETVFQVPEGILAFKVNRITSTFSSVLLC